MICLTEDVLQFCNNMKGCTNSKTRESHGAAKQSLYKILMTLVSAVCGARACIRVCVHVCTRMYILQRKLTGTPRQSLY